MAKERGNSELRALLVRHGLVAEKRVDAFRRPSGQGIQRPAHPGRPDYIIQYVCDGRRHAAEVEFKAVDGVAPFHFDRIRPEQRLWLAGGPDEAAGADWVCDSWLALTMGTQPHYRAHPRQFWLIPWTAWLEGETRLRETGATSLPYSAETARLPHHPGFRENGWGARELLSPFALDWESGVGWRIPPDHPFARRYGPFSIRSVVDTNPLPEAV